MKIFLYTLYAAFLFAMGTGFYVAYRSAEGLVEDNYYEAACDYFTTKAIEDSLDLEIVLPDSFKKGNNVVEVAVYVQGEPLQQVSVSFFSGNVSKRSYDAQHDMVESSPGIYRTEVSIPFAGKWFMRVDVANETIKTSRRWFTEIE
ncbi:FixH family protein [Prosthecochloris sp. SCSIO W1101]|uniref:FixH family protein n=1 Tax=Prosthecochloris sp. SCSIO W1101 TaxID=2992242 RepID=UPI00223CEA8C|nr:FixH family protein [Prosthecochloris sp. SCSIO W1101]UZJ42344.1 FixH family protein [Prosthecochloris sp. SCSIO W1101]